MLPSVISSTELEFLSVSKPLTGNFPYPGTENAYFSSQDAYDVVRVSHSIPSAAHIRAPTASEIIHMAAGPRGEEEAHPTHRYMSFSALGQEFELELYKNHRLLHPDYKETRQQGPESHRQRVVRTRKDVVNCFYRGLVRNHKGSGRNMAAISTCGGVSGYIQAHGDIYWIAPLESHAHLMSADKRKQSYAAGSHIVFRVADLTHPLAAHEPPDQEFHCGVGATSVDSNHVHSHSHSHGADGEHEHDHDHEHRDAIGSTRDLVSAMARAVRGARDVGAQAVGARKYVEILAVNDYARFQQKLLQTEQHTLFLYNLVASIYTSSSELNSAAFEFILKGQVTWITTDANVAFNQYSENAAEIDVSSYISNFQSWYTSTSAGEYIFSSRSVDNVAIISGNDFQSGVVGFAYTSTMCTSFSVGINQATFQDTFTAATIAHEIGHNFGMCHDPPASRNSNSCGALTDTDCGGHTMSASSNPSSPYMTFSHCSNTDVLTNLVGQSENEACLEEPSAIVRYGNYSVCGNGFAEGDEACDCGPYLDCASAPAPWTDPCCTPTCNLTATAKCSDQQPCCSQCEVVTHSLVCRAKGQSNTATEECDLEEYCNGVSASCPEDLFKDDGQICPFDALAFASAWLKDNWQKLVVGVVVLLFLYYTYHGFLHLWHWCFGDYGHEEHQKHLSKEAKRRKKNKQPEQPKAIHHRIRDHFRQTVRTAQLARHKEHMAQQQQNLPLTEEDKARVKEVRKTAAAIKLPEPWKLKFRRNGEPVFQNQKTLEVHAFLKGPPKAGDKSKGKGKVSQAAGKERAASPKPKIPLPQELRGDKLPAHWKIKYTKTGRKVYLNTKKNKVYEFDETADAPPKRSATSRNSRSSRSPSARSAAAAAGGAQAVYADSASSAAKPKHAEAVYGDSVSAGDVELSVKKTRSQRRSGSRSPSHSGQVTRDYSAAHSTPTRSPKSESQSRGPAGSRRAHKARTATHLDPPEM